MLQNDENYTSWVGDERLIETPPLVADLRCLRKPLTQTIRVPMPPLLHRFPQLNYEHSARRFA
jgi:hypothetical protein